jgi:hypothetical protein
VLKSVAGEQVVAKMLVRPVAKTTKRRSPCAHDNPRDQRKFDQKSESPLKNRKEEKRDG